MEIASATMPPAPFTPSFPISSLADVRRLEAVPLGDALTVRSTYEIFRNSAHAFGDKTALTFLPSADPGVAPVRWSYAQLLAGIHQTANLLHRLGLRAHDTVAILLPGCVEYQLALWGGEAAGIVQPLNPLLSDEKLVSLMTVARAKVLIAWGRDDDSDIWSKSLRMRSHVPTLTHVLCIAPPGGCDRAARGRPRLQRRARTRTRGSARGRTSHRAC